MPYVALDTDPIQEIRANDSIVSVLFPLKELFVLAFLRNFCPCIPVTDTLRDALGENQSDLSHSPGGSCSVKNSTDALT